MKFLLSMSNLNKGIGMGSCVPYDRSGKVSLFLKTTASFFLMTLCIHIVTTNSVYNLPCVKTNHVYIIFTNRLRIIYQFFPNVKFEHSIAAYFAI
jgi:hypothetical protein